MAIKENGKIIGTSQNIKSGYRPDNEIMREIRDDLLRLFRQVLKDFGTRTKPPYDNTLNEKSNVYRTSNVKINYNTKEHIEFNIFYNKYLEYVDAGREPRLGKEPPIGEPKLRKKPPITEIKDWARRRGFKTDNRTLWAISTRIWSDGYSGRPIFSNFNRLLQEKAFGKEDSYLDKVFLMLVKDLDKKFKIKR
jgi:hypothetical protein